MNISECNLLDLLLFCFGIWQHPPIESLTAASCPFFLVHTYFPLLACSATCRPSHTISNMVLALLQRQRKNSTCPIFYLRAIIGKGIKGIKHALLHKNYTSTKFIILQLQHVLMFYILIFFSIDDQRMTHFNGFYCYI